MAERHRGANRYDVVGDTGNQYPGEALYNTLKDRCERTEAEVERLRTRLTEAQEALVQRDEEIERLRARLCYVNPDGSHVRGCAQHEAQHPAQWCEVLGLPKECYVNQTKSRDRC
jgi:hypothetical protein